MGCTKDSIAVSRSFSACEASNCWRVSRSRANCKNTSLLLCRLSRASSPNTPCNCSRALDKACSRSALTVSSVLSRDRNSSVSIVSFCSRRARHTSVASAPRRTPATSAAHAAPSLIRGRSYAAAGVEPAQEIESLLQVAIAAPRGGILIGPQVAVVRNQRRHAGRMRGLNVALSIADVDAFAGRDPDELRGVQQGQGMRLAFGQRIAADDAVEARAQAQL